MRPQSSQMRVLPVRGKSSNHKQANVFLVVNWNLLAMESRVQGYIIKISFIHLHSKINVLHVACELHAGFILKDSPE